MTVRPLLTTKKYWRFVVGWKTTKHTLHQTLKLAVKSRPHIFVELCKACLVNGIFRRIRERQKLVLLPKPDMPSVEPSSFRLISLLVTMGKKFE